MSMPFVNLHKTKTALLPARFAPLRATSCRGSCHHEPLSSLLFRCVRTRIGWGISIGITLADEIWGDQLYNWIDSHH